MESVRITLRHAAETRSPEILATYGNSAVLLSRSVSVVGLVGLRLSPPRCKAHIGGSAAILTMLVREAEGQRGLDGLVHTTKYYG